MATSTTMSTPLDDFASMPPIMTAAMLAEHLPDVEERTLQDWRYRRIGPTYTRDAATRRVYYLRSDVIAWLRASRKPTTPHQEGTTP